MTLPALRELWHERLPNAGECTVLSFHTCVRDSNHTSTVQRTVPLCPSLSCPPLTTRLYCAVPFMLPRDHRHLRGQGPGHPRADVRAAEAHTAGPEILLFRHAYHTG
jgi:hypothetical protein